MKYAIIGLALFSGVAMADCDRAARNTYELMDDAKVVIDKLADGDITEANVRALARRLDSAERSLISVKIYCHDRPEKIKAANGIADIIDEIRARVGF